jgi:multidrug transporter EmrE-like cation transporter
MGISVIPFPLAHPAVFTERMRRDDVMLLDLDKPIGDDHRHRRRDLMALAAYTVTYVALTTSGLLLVRRSLPKLSDTPGGLLSDLAGHPQVIAGCALYALSFLTFLLALRRFELSIVYPLFVGCAYGAVAVCSWLVLEERISLERALGIAVVGLGLILVLR